MSVGFVPGDGPLRRAHPFTPVTLTAVLVTLAFALPGPLGPVAICLVAVVIPLVEGVPGVLRPAALTSLPFWVFLFTIHGVLSGHPAVALGIAARITAVIVAFLTLIAVVQPARMVDALLERRVPFTVAYVFAATLQAVPRLRARGHQILAAQRCRGLRVKGSPLARARAIVPLAVPLVLSALAEVDERAFALEARGIGQATRRTPLHPPADTIRQKKTRWALVAAAAATVALRILW